MLPTPFSEELADGALEWAESLYATVPPYRDGWSQIHPQDREDWLAGFRDLREPLDSLVRWRDEGLLTRGQKARFAALLARKAEFDPVISELERGAPLPSPLRRLAGSDEYDLL